ncbi:MAG TPA: hypothetical protein VMZ27_16030 [Candidatus Saccharimonadales bacterium]|nr:hypothetical protein [Candidatus Saccharimonadales bacterium]
MTCSLFNHSRIAFRSILVALSVLSLWRVIVCLSEYQAGPFVSVSRTLLDQTSFWALAGVIAAYYDWNRGSRRSTRLVLFSTGMLLIAAFDLVRFNVTAREHLYAAAWSGLSKNVELEDDVPYLNVTFTTNQEAVFLLGTNRTEIFRGEWRMAFDSVRGCQTVTLAGFGQADYWNYENMHVRARFNVGGKSYGLWAQLKPTPHSARRAL